MERKYKLVATKVKKTKRKKHFSDYVVFISLTCVILYTSGAFLLQFMGFYEISSTLTACFFTFFASELVALAMIKREKVKSETEEKSTQQRSHRGE